MNKDKKTIQKKRAQRSKRVRARIRGTKTCPRLSVFHSNIHTYAQLIDDVAGKTIIGIRSEKPSSRKTKKMTKIGLAYEVGKKLAEEAKKRGIKRAVFDRGSHSYHGRTKAVAEGAREGGLSF